MVPINLSFYFAQVLLTSSAKRDTRGCVQNGSKKFKENKIVLLGELKLSEVAASGEDHVPSIRQR